MVLLTQIIENNYDVDTNLLGRILNDLNDLIVGLKANKDFVAALEHSRVETEYYWSELEDTAYGLKMSIDQRIAKKHSLMIDDNTIP